MLPFRKAAHGQGSFNTQPPEGGWFMLGNVTTAYTIDLLKLQAFVAGEDAPEGDEE